MQLNVKQKKVLDLAIPATIENILQTLVGFVDTLMISRLGLVAVTAVGISNNIFSVYLAVIIALGVAASSQISRRLGAGNRDEARKTAVQAILLAAVLGLIFGLATVLFNDEILAVMGAGPDVIHLALPYFNLVGGAIVLMAVLSVLGSILRATGDTRTPMYVNTLVNLLNIVLDYILIFGLGPVPALGILGTAIGTVGARLTGSILMLKKVQQSPAAFKFGQLFEKSSWQNGRELIGLSIPAVLERLVMRLGQVVYFGLILAIGVKTYAAHMIAGNIESFTYMPGMGLAAAASILVGNSFGAGNKQEAYEYARESMKAGAVIMSLGGVLLFFGAPWFAGWFTRDGEALTKIITALRIDAFAQIPLAVSLISAGALQGSGDTRSPLYSTAIGMWGVRVLGVYLLGIRLGMGIAGVWLSILIDLSLRAVFLLIRFRRRTLTA